MKKTIIALSAVIALSVAIYGYGYDMNPKKKACEAGCDTTYNKCKDSAEKDFKKDKDEAKKTAKIEACKVAKDECYKKCSK
ncbi:MAG: hypothetical protein V1874_03320 [Spirochaetota bacterium]